VLGSLTRGAALVAGVADLLLEIRFVASSPTRLELAPDAPDCNREDADGADASRSVLRSGSRAALGRNSIIAP
jgi:hypothetical protein